MIVVPTLHPAFLLRSSDGHDGQAKFKPTVIDDFRKALAYRYREPDWDESILWKKVGDRFVNLFPTLDEVSQFVRRAYEGQLITAVDIETTGEEPLNCKILCIGMATEDGNAICVPILRQGGFKYWSHNEEDEVKRLLKFLLASVYIPKCFHNGSFDTSVLFSHGFTVNAWACDTMVAKHCADSELPNSLGFVASRYLEIPYYKDDVKGGESWINMDDFTLRLYNGRDCLTTIRVLPLLLAECKKHGLMDLYSQEIEMSKIMVGATIKGVLVETKPHGRLHNTDIDDREQIQIEKNPKKPPVWKPNPDHGYPIGLGPKMRVKRDHSLYNMRKILGWNDFNPRSVVMQLRDALYNKLKFPIVKRTDKTNEPSTDKEAMILLALHAETNDQVDFLKNLVKWKKADKLISTWVEGLPILPDSRVHASWKNLTTTGRLASSPNMQNWSAAVKRIFTVPGRWINDKHYGSKLVSVDLSQAELRGIGYWAGDQSLLEMYQQGINVHTVNTTLLFHVKHPGVDSNPQTDAYLASSYPTFNQGRQVVDLPSLPEKKWKKARRLAKNFVFGSIYQAEPDTIYKVLRAERDAETDEPLFSDVTLGEVEALKIAWESMHPAIVRYWASINAHVQKQGFYRCPISGRIRWFRGGFKSNEVVNMPIQSSVASWMNKCTIEIAKYLWQACGPSSQLILQVHDALTTETEDQYVKVTKEILTYVLSQKFDLTTPTGPRYQQACLPPDDPTVGVYLDEV